MGFSKLNLHDKIIKAIKVAGYTSPTQIQKESITHIIDRNDIRASAQTGTGKTAAFLLPALHLLEDTIKRSGKGAKILILTPTRELAQQITLQADKYSKFMNNIKSVCVVGGVPYHKQQSKLSRAHDILIATPGRLIDYIKRGKINLSNVEMVILDEADRMLDMGFSESVEDILSKTPKTRQTLLFSATLDGEVLKLSEKFMKNPIEIKIHSSKEKHESIEQKLHYVDNLSHKNDLLDHILNAEDLTSAIVFTATKRHCDELVDELEDKGFLAGALHGDMNQRQRTRTLKMLKEGKINILVATDVAGRGIDIPSISHVINFDLPRETGDYVHRIGRTGRAGKSGIAISFAGKKDIHLIPRIEKYTGQKISVVEIKGLEPKSKPRAQNTDSPKSRRSSPRNRSRSSRSDRDSRGSGGRRDGKKSFGGRSDSPRSGDRKDSRGSFGGRADSKGSGERRKTSKSNDRKDSRGSFGGRSDSKGSNDRRDSRGSFGGRSDSRGSNDRRDSRGSFGGRSDSRDSNDRRDSRGSFGGRSDSRGSNDRRDSRGSFGGRSDSKGSNDRRDSRGSFGGRSDSRGSNDRRDSRGSFGGRSDSRGSNDRRDSRGSFGGRSDSKGSNDRRDSRGSFGGRSDSRGSNDRRDSRGSNEKRSFSGRSDSPRSGDRRRSNDKPKSNGPKKSSRPFPSR